MKMRKFKDLGSVVTNHGYSDWATTDISSDIKHMWYRFSRRESDYCIENSEDGIHYKQMRIFHMWEGSGKITYGIYACSPTEDLIRQLFPLCRLRIVNGNLTQIGKFKRRI